MISQQLSFLAFYLDKSLSALYPFANSNVQNGNVELPIYYVVLCNINSLGMYVRPKLEAFSRKFHLCVGQLILKPSSELTYELQM